MQRINLYQDQFRSRRDPTDAGHLALWLLLAVIVLAAISGALAWRARVAEQRLAEARAQQAAVSERLDGLRARLTAARDEAAAPQGRLSRLRAELEAKRRLLDYLDSGPLAERTGFSPYLRDLARHAVEGVWLERIVLADGGKRLRMDGHATSPERLPALMAGLGEAEAYSGHSFRTLDMRRPEEASERLDFVLATEPVDVDSGDGRGRGKR